LFEEKGTLQPQLLNASVETCKTLARGVIGFFDLVHSLLQLNAFLAVSCFDGGREFWRDATWRFY
jgi:hypothetical protein